MTAIVADRAARRFEGRTVIVTGGSRGLGRAMAAAFGAEGAFVVVGYLARAKDAEDTVALVREAGGDARALAFDVSKRADVDAAIDLIAKERGRIDVLINNAGVARDELFPLMTQESWDEVLATNLGGLFHCARAVVRPMLAAGGGAIVNVGAVAALRASPGQVNYAASKGGLVAFTRSLGAELAPRGIRVNAVLPGAIAAGLAARLDRRIAERIRGAIPLGRFGTAEEVARVVLFLASGDAAYIVGQALVVDGGLTA
jgi:3-oxoacyl-[acyl-carrier protein] reductase